MINRHLYCHKTLVRSNLKSFKIQSLSILKNKKNQILNNYIIQEKKGTIMSGESPCIVFVVFSFYKKRMYVKRSYNTSRIFLVLRNLIRHSIVSRPYASCVCVCVCVCVFLKPQGSCCDTLNCIWTWKICCCASFNEMRLK